MLVAVPFGEIEPGDVQIHQCPFELRWVAALGAQFARVVCRFGQQRAGGPSWTGDRRVFSHHLFHIAVADDQPRQMRTRCIGEPAAQIHVRADVIYSRGQSLQYQRGLVGS